MLVIGEAADDPHTLCLTEALQPESLFLDAQPPQTSKLETLSTLHARSPRHTS